MLFRSEGEGIAICESTFGLDGILVEEGALTGRTPTKKEWDDIRYGWQVAEAIGPGITKKDCALVVDGFLNAVKLALAKGENIEIRGFGTFKVRKRKTRMARNPRTGDPVEVPSRSVPVFKPSKHLRIRVERLDDRRL